MDKKRVKNPLHITHCTYIKSNYTLHTTNHTLYIFYENYSLQTLHHTLHMYQYKQHEHSAQQTLSSTPMPAASHWVQRWIHLVHSSMLLLPAIVFYYITTILYKMFVLLDCLKQYNPLLPPLPHGFSLLHSLYLTAL